MVLYGVRGWAAALAVVLTLGLHTNAGAQPSQETFAKYRGLWFQGDSCAAPRGFKLIGRDTVYSGTFDLNNSRQFLIWTYGAFDIFDRAAGRIGVRVRNKISIVQRVSDRMFSIQSDLSDTNADYFRCDEPGAKSAEAKQYLDVLRRAASVQADYDALDAKCRPLERLAHDCAEEIVRMADVNGDGKLAPAELTNFLRRAVSVGFLLGGSSQQGGREIPVSADDLPDIDSEATMFAPFVARTAFANLDFNNDGFLSVDEIAIGLQREDLASALLNGNRLFGAGTTRAAEAYAALDGLSRLFGVKK